ncbi:MAG TPA: M15 family metallopeptidase [Acidimicrobiales bacterium]|nr:M15 family metallopeptidase [Acidimicrobiales bacterium]
MTLVRRRSLVAAAVLATLVSAVVLPPVPSGAQEDPASERGQIDAQGLVSIDFDVLKADDGIVSDALTEVKENVQSQKLMLLEAESTLGNAELQLSAAEAALAETELALAGVNDQTDTVVVDAFINPPADSALDVLTADSLEDATVKSQILDIQADKDAEALDYFLTLQNAYETQKTEQENAASAAEAARAEAEAALADVNAAVGQQAAFAAEVQRRLDRQLSEADALANTDPALAEALRGRAAELAEALNNLDEEVQAEKARQLAAELAEEADAVKGISGIKPVAGGVADVACPDGGVVQVAGAISGQIERLLADASEAGITLCGYGYRDPAEQIAVRRANCGTSNYAIYQAPSSACSPPTARPGQSLHEQGLAIDFTVGGRTIGSTSAAYKWLKANAANYGMYNLPSEPWHWSVSGD